MTIPQIKKVVPVPLRSLGVDEKWLQDRIAEDPSILGLGDLEVAAREHPQPVGGRIDFLLRKPEEDLYFEVEIMLGTLYESHIIRTIEYWDIERQRRPLFDHRAVIVAENITSRFFNVIRLLNRSVPLMAIKLSAIKGTDGTISIFPVTVLDIIEESFDDRSVAPTERVDRGYWEKKSPSMLSILDKLVTYLIEENISVNATYNKHHIALGTTGYNFCWLNPRKAPRCSVEIRVPGDLQEVTITKLQNSGIEASPRDTKFLYFSTTLPDFEKNSAVLRDVFKQAEKSSTL